MSARARQKGSRSTWRPRWRPRWTTWFRGASAPARVNAESEAGGGATNAGMGAVSNSSQIPPPPLPPIEPERRPRAGVVRGGVGEIVVVTKWGKVTYYAHDERFEAVCKFHQEEAGGTMRRCRLTRTTRANPRRRAQGRPLGLMLAWLTDEGLRPPTKEEHVSSMHVGTAYSASRRKHWRGVLKGLENGLALLSKERPLGADSDPEPEACP